MIYVIMKVKFEEGADIDNITAQFYKDNEKAINGMTADTLKDEKAFQDFQEKYKEFQEA